MASCQQDRQVGVMAAARDAVRRYDHGEFVERFLGSLSSALQVNSGERVQGVKRNIDGIRSDGGMTTSRKVINARMALGADDSTYLNTGLGLLWAGDDVKDDEHLLFPSSLGNAGIQASTQRALRSSLTTNIEGQIDASFVNLATRLPSLLYIMSIPEVFTHLRSQLTALNMWIDRSPTSLASLLTEMTTGGDRNRINADFNEKIKRWVSRCKRGSAAHIEELITVTSELAGLYMHYDDEPETISPMTYADIYTSSAVDVALARDYSSMDGVLRSYRAKLIHDTGDGPNGQPVNAAGQRDETLRDNAPPIPAPMAPPQPRRRTRLATATPGFTGVAVVEPIGDMMDADGEGGWLGGFGTHRVAGSALNFGGAPIGAHSHGVDGQGHTAVARAQEHRIELSEDQRIGDLSPPTEAITRVDNVVIGPITGMARLSMRTAASPLWSADAINPIVARQMADRPAHPLFDTVGNGMVASRQEINAVLNQGRAPGDAPNAPPRPRARDDQLRVVASMMMRSLYDDSMGRSRETPEEVDFWLIRRGDIAYREVLPDLGGKAASIRGTNQVMATYSNFAGGDHRFVSYVILRGLVADPGPDQHPTNDNPIQPLQYSRGARITWNDPDIHAPGPRNAPPALLNQPLLSETVVVPAPIYNHWATSRDGMSEHAEELTRMIRMNGPTTATGAPFDQWEVNLQIAAENRRRGGLQPPEGRLTDPEEERLRYDARLEMELRVPLLLNVTAVPGGADEEKQQPVTGNQWVAARVKWAPVGTTGIGRAQTRYNEGAISASAASTYEHLVDAASGKFFKNNDEDNPRTSERTRVPENLRGALQACLKLRQLPHMLRFDEEADGGTVTIQNIVRDAGDAATPIAADEGYGIFMPTYRTFGQDVLEPVAPALSGVWPVLADDGNDQRDQFRKTRPYPGAVTAANDPLYNYEHLRTLHQASLGLAVGQITAPEGYLNLPHIPIGLPSTDPDDGANIPAMLTLPAATHVAQAARPRTELPIWLNSDDRIANTIRECYQLSARVRELRLQRAAFAADEQEPAPTEAIPSLVERERRGAIWEDALREMSISQDRLYNFLRTMSGTLHEDINAVVEVEDHAMEASNRAVRERRQEILKQSAQFQSRLVERVMAGVLKDSKLQFDITADPNAAGTAAAKELVVINRDTVERVKELAQGQSGMPFFQQNVELAQALGSNTQPMTVARLVSTLQGLATTMRQRLLANLDDSTLDGARSTLEYLSKPRNSYLVRLKPEAFAAIKSAYSVFTQEWRTRAYTLRRPSAWELIEGVDMHLTNAFAELCAHKLAHSRMFGSSHAAYIGVAPAKANATQLRIALSKVVARAMEYVQLVPPPNYSMGAASYTAQMPNDYTLQWDPAAGRTMSGDPTFQRGRRWGWNLEGSA